jgi:hypothetical protein
VYEFLFVNFPFNIFGPWLTQGNKVKIKTVDKGDCCTSWLNHSSWGHSEFSEPKSSGKGWRGSDRGGKDEGNPVSPDLTHSSLHLCGHLGLSGSETEGLRGCCCYLYPPLLFSVSLDSSPSPNLWKCTVNSGGRSMSSEVCKCKWENKSPSVGSGRGICHFTAHYLERKETGVGSCWLLIPLQLKSSMNRRELCSSQSGTLAKITGTWGRSCFNQKQQQGSFGLFGGTWWVRWIRSNSTLTVTTSF